MADIRHSVHVEAPASAVFPLVATGAGMATWWTPRVDREEEAASGRLRLHFGDWDGQTVLQREEVEANRRVEYLVVSNNEGDEWPGTRLVWELEAEGSGTRMRFAHRDWREATDYFGECNGFWGFFMLRIKELAEAAAEV